MRQTLWGLVSPFVCAAVMASPADDTPPGTTENRAAPLTLSVALAAAVERSPDLAPLEWRIRAAEAEAGGLGARPNPELGLELENFGGGSGLDDAETTFSITQLFELGGKRGKRRRALEGERAVARFDAEAARLDVIAETTRRFFDVLGAQERLELAGQLLETADEIAGAVDRRVRAGASSAVEASRARVEAEMVRIDRENAARALDTARSRLAAMWGGAPQFDIAAGVLDEVVDPPPYDALIALLDRNPALARWTAETARRGAVIEAERSAGLPDVAVGAGVRRASDDTAFIVELGVPLPLFDRNRGATESASFRHRQAESEATAARNRVRTELGAARDALASAHAEVVSLRDRAISNADGAFEAARTGYLRGSMRLTDVLDIERLLYELKSRHVDALVRYHHARADIDRLVGGPTNPTGSDSE